MAASAIGHQAAYWVTRVLYTSTPKLFAKLKMAKPDGSYIKEIAQNSNGSLTADYG